ncbi:hypothetical protein [uncultured Methylophaga sp.]
MPTTQGPLSVTYFDEMRPLSLISMDGVYAKQFLEHCLSWR